LRWNAIIYGSEFEDDGDKMDGRELKNERAEFYCRERMQEENIS